MGGFWETAKNVPASAKKNGQNCFGNFVKMPIKHLGKLVQTQITDCKNLSLWATRVLYSAERPNSARISSAFSLRGEKDFCNLFFGVRTSAKQVPDPTRYPVLLSIPNPTRFIFGSHRVAGNPKIGYYPPFWVSPVRGGLSHHQMLFSGTGTHKKDPRVQKKCEICHFNVKYDSWLH